MFKTSRYKKGGGILLLNLFNHLNNLAIQIYFFPPFLPQGHIVFFFSLKHGYALHNYSFSQSVSQQIQEVQDWITDQHQPVGGDADNDCSAYTVLTRETYLAKK